MEIFSPETRREASYLLNLARAERDACQAEKKLADSQVKEIHLRAKLCCIRAKKAQWRLYQANQQVGKVRSVISKSGHLGVLDSSHPPKFLHVHKFEREQFHGLKI
jgi:hypothetical protein